MTLRNPHPALLGKSGNLRFCAIAESSIVELSNWIFNRLVLQHSELFPMDYDIEQRPYGAIIDHLPTLPIDAKDKMMEALLGCLDELCGDKRVQWAKNNGGHFLIYTVGRAFEGVNSLPCESALQRLALGAGESPAQCADAANSLVLMGARLPASFWSQIYQSAPRFLKDRLGAIALGGLSNIGFESVILWMQSHNISSKSIEAVIAPILITALRQDGSDIKVLGILERHSQNLSLEHKQILDQAARDIEHPGIIPPKWDTNAPAISSRPAKINTGSPFWVNLPATA